MSTVKERYNAVQEEHIDHKYLIEEGWWHRLVVRLFASHFARFTNTLIDRAYERSIIDSYTMHYLAGMKRRMTHPKITPLRGVKGAQ